MALAKTRKFISIFLMTWRKGNSRTSHNADILLIENEEREQIDNLIFLFYARRQEVSHNRNIVSSQLNNLHWYIFMSFNKEGRTYRVCLEKTRYFLYCQTIKFCAILKIVIFLILCDTEKFVPITFKFRLNKSTLDFNNNLF